MGDTPSASVSLPELIRAIRGQIPNEKCDLLEDLVQKLQKRELRLNRQEFLLRIKDIAGDDAPALRMALKQLAVDRRAPDPQPSSLGSGSAGVLPSAAPAPAPAPAAAVPDATDAPDGPDGPVCAQQTGPLGGQGEMARTAAASASQPMSVGANLGMGGGDARTGDAPRGADATNAACAGPPSAPSSASALAPAAQQQQQQQQQQRLEVAAAAVLVHAAGCMDQTCKVPHCNKMRKIHTHFLECNTADCAICKKLKPLTYIHAKHCVSAPGEQCVIPYCARAKKELHLLVQRRGGVSGADELRLVGSSSGVVGGGRPAMSDGSSAPASLTHSTGMPSGIVSSGLALESMNTHSQAHYLLVLAHVMKCPSANCTVPECAPTKALVTNHTRSCRAGDACAYPRCALSKRLMRHHRECPDQMCSICLPLRRRLAAAKIGVAAAAQPDPNQQPKRKPTKRKKEDRDDDDMASGDPKRKRKEGEAGGQLDARVVSRKRAAAPAAAQEAQEAQMTGGGDDLLESGFCVSVLFASGKRALPGVPGEESRGDWRSGIVMRAHKSADDDEMVYDIMMAEGKEEKSVPHSRCRMVCHICLTDKRTFRPPSMYCEKCFTAIHQRWSYWEEGGDEGGLKLCKRCYADIKASAKPNRVLADLAHRNNLQIDNFIEKKEKDRPEYVDNWVQCDECHAWMHWTCGLYKGEDTPDDCLFFCDTCRLTRGKALAPELTVPSSAELAENALSQALQAKLHKELSGLGVTCNPVTVRVVSNVETVTKFDKEQAPGGAIKGAGEQVVIGKTFPYRSKCILAFQHVEGHEVCFFSMYVQEYGSDCPEPNTNRVYISYLDSVRYFKSQPEGHRTTVYHSILVNYLAYVRELGFTHAHIWVSPPKHGDDFIFYAHPETMVQKRMGLLKLKEWYEKMLEVAKSRGIVVEYQDMQEVYKDIESIEDIPMFSGDHWAASIVNKMQELRNKREDAKDPKSKPKGSSSTAHGDALGEETKDDLLLNQITEEMRSMRNHFIVVTLLELKKGQQRAVIHDPVPLISNEFVDTRSAFLERCQMYHWQFDELRNAQHSTLMLLYHLHGMHRAAKAKLALQAVEKVQPKEGVGGVPAGASRSPGGGIATSRSSKIETAMHDWSTLLAHANQAATSVGGLPPTWALPPDDLFQRILAQINRSKRDILQEKYNACLSPTCSAQARSVFIRVLKRIAESFMTCLLQMQMQVGAGDPNAQPRPSVPQPAQANGWGRV